MLGKDHDVWQAFGLAPMGGQRKAPWACPLALSVEDMVYGGDDLVFSLIKSTERGFCPECGMEAIEDHEEGCGLGDLALIANDFIDRFDAGEFPDLEE